MSWKRRTAGLASGVRFGGMAMSRCPGRAVAAIALMLAGLAAGPSLAQGRAGTTWYETESGWDGRWRRRADSDIWDAEWRHPNGERETATLRILIRGDDVYIERRQSRGECTYTGRLHSDGRRASGTYTCDWSGSGAIPWSAEIE